MEEKRCCTLKPEPGGPEVKTTSAAQLAGVVDGVLLLVHRILTQRRRPWPASPKEARELARAAREEAREIYQDYQKSPEAHDADSAAEVRSRVIFAERLAETYRALAELLHLRERLLAPNPRHPWGPRCDDPRDWEDSSCALVQYYLQLLFAGLPG